jgi:hypothetical protein
MENSPTKTSKLRRGSYGRAAQRLVQLVAPWLVVTVPGWTSKYSKSYLKLRAVDEIMRWWISAVK